jgi:hypothetical protein
MPEQIWRSSWERGPLSESVYGTGGPLMSDMWSATPTFAARKKRIMTALMSALILLGGALAAV